MVIITGGSDISVSGILPFCAIMFAYMMRWGIPIGVALVLGILLGGCIGLINNLLRRILRIHPMIVTMAMQLTLRGLNLAITGGSVVSDLPEGFAVLAGFRPLGISLAIWLYIILAIFFLVFSKKNAFFLKIFFVGGNEEASRLSGIRTENILRFVYVVNGLLAGLAGVLSTIVYSSASYSYGQGVELKVITAVAIGGTSMTHGGEGSIVGTMLGTLFMALIYNAFIQSGISTYYQDVFTGTMLIVAVLASELLRALKKKGTLQAKA
jgi:ribose transport system permease protein